MKKVLSFAVVAALFGIAVSCSHDDNNYNTGVSPAAEQDTINQFIEENGLTNLTKDTAQYFQGYLMSQRISAGDQNRKVADSIPVVYFRITGQLLDGQTFFTSADTTIRYNFSQYATDNSSTASALIIPTAVQYYLLTLGEGGSVSFVTPSAYAYSYQSGTISGSSVTIPANSPLYYSRLIIDSIRSK